MITSYRHQGYKIAVDDCGAGFSGLQLLYYTEPDCIKIDRFFIQDIETDSKKRLFVSSIVEIAHLMGSIVVAEGVETRKEYYSCRNIGCDLVQGYFVQTPQVNLENLKETYQEIDWLDKTERRNKTTFDKTLVKAKDIGNIIANLKRKAKQSRDHLYVDTISDFTGKNQLQSAGGF